MHAAHVPMETRFATKPALAVQMIARTIAADVPFAWVAADSVYGVGDVEQALRRAGKGYVLGVGSNHHFGSWVGKPAVFGTAGEIAQDVDPAAWHRLSAGEGTKGARLHDWAYLELADIEATDYGEGRPGVWTRGLLIRRHIADGELAFFTTWCPAGTGIDALVHVEGHRWAIEDSFETTKNELGLDHNETRSWHGWHRHVSLVMLAFAMMAVIRHHANEVTPPKECARHPGADPLVCTRSPTHCRSARPARYRTGPHHRMVVMATSAPSGRPPRTSKDQNATVMLIRTPRTWWNTTKPKAGTTPLATGRRKRPVQE
jgi:SRSO17 transposase